MAGAMRPVRRAARRFVGANRGESVAQPPIWQKIGPQRGPAWARPTIAFSLTPYGPSRRISTKRTELSRSIPTISSSSFSCGRLDRFPTRPFRRYRTAAATIHGDVPQSGEPGIFLPSAFRRSVGTERVRKTLPKQQMVVPNPRKDASNTVLNAPGWFGKLASHLTQAFYITCFFQMPHLLCRVALWHRASVLNAVRFDHEIGPCGDKSAETIRKRRNAIASAPIDRLNRYSPVCPTRRRPTSGGRLPCWRLGKWL